ncbi:KAP family P-loop NTPase fold protein [Tenacibaculum sp.]|uniref:KAP family P-loop NTPase fold protein n=1 Tax=Tenacibaculum sp. TaxID=1906242 RepID=UPI003AA980FA
MNFIKFSPIKSKNEDLFNFSHYAKKVQRILQNNSNNIEPITVGVYGKWGEGKTSFLNLLEKQIDVWKEKKENQKGILKYHFNPWRYSSEDEMLFDFFDGLSKLMFLKKENTLQKIGKQLVKYSRYVKAVKVSASVGLSSSNKIGSTFEISEIMKAMGEDFIGKETTLVNLIEDINQKLNESDYKVVVFIDDVDRLDKDEIYTILKLIKLNASFNNFVYIIAMDQDYVSKAIKTRYGDEEKDGKLFLEKIINIPVHLPKIEKEDYKLFFNIKLKEVVDNLNLSKREEEIGEIRQEFKYYYFKNAREIIRVLNSFFLSAFAIGEEVNLRDLFWVDYLKIVDAEVYNHIKEYIHYNINKRLIVKASLFRGIGDLNTDYKMLRKESSEIVGFLFPDRYNDVLKQKLEEDEGYVKLVQKESRINSREHFEKYFSYHTIRKISNVERKKIIQNIRDKDVGRLKENFVYVRDNRYIEVHHFYGLVEDLINEQEIDYIFFYDFLLSNLDLLPETEIDVFGLSYQLRIIELIASILDKKEDEINIVSLAEKLNVSDLCYFTRKIKIKSKVREDLNKSIGKKAEGEFIEKSIPFY